MLNYTILYEKVHQKILFFSLGTMNKFMANKQFTQERKVNEAVNVIIGE